MRFIKLIVGIAGIIGVWLFLFDQVGGVSIEVKVFTIAVSLIYSIVSEKSWGLLPHLVRRGLYGN